MTTPRRRLCAAVVVAVLSVLLAPWIPSSAADEDEPDLAVTITGLTPSALVPGQPVTMTGTVTNGNDFAWSELQAYLVIPRAPFTSRDQLATAVAAGPGYTGERVTALDLIDQIGTLEPGAGTTFSLTVPWEALELTGAEGVYPVGVQLLGTRPSGERRKAAVGRATTFLPLVGPDRPGVPGTLAWPFLLPGPGTDLAAAVAPGGRLRNLLDLATSTPVTATTIVVDPALLDALAALPDDPDTEAFTDDLVDLTRRGSTWATGYGIPDLATLVADGGRGERLRAIVDTATDEALADAGVVPQRTVAWIGDGGLDSTVVGRVTDRGERPVVVSSTVLPDWDRRDGSITTYPADDAPVPLLVVDDLAAGVPGAETAVTLRQRLLAAAALGSLQRGADPTSRADAVTVVAPTFDPGTTWRPAGLDTVWQTPWITATTLDGLLLTPLAQTGARIDRPDTAGLSGSVLDAVDDLRATGALLESLAPDDSSADDPLARAIAGFLSLAGRDDPAGVAAAARSRSQDLMAELDGITIEGPPSFILSGTTGEVPVTISNGTSRTISVGVRISSTNPALDVPDVDPVEIGPGQRNTVDVVVDVGRQNTSTLTAQLITSDGTALGDPATFNVRSSNVGTVIWVAMGVAGALVVVALVRRFVVRRRGSR